MGSGRGVSILAALTANGLLAAGLLIWGWSIWTAIAAIWIENLVEMPFLANRIRRALDALPPDQLATYLRVSRAELDVHAPGFGLERLRRILVGDPPARTGSDAARHFLLFWIPFLGVLGLFLATFGLMTGLESHAGELVLARTPFDGVGLLGVGAGVLLAELVTLWLDRRAARLMPDTSGFERRFILLTLIVVLAGWVLGLLGPASGLVAAAFVAMKTVADLRSGYLPQRFGSTPG